MILSNSKNSLALKFSSPVAKFEFVETLLLKIRIQCRCTAKLSVEEIFISVFYNENHAHSKKYKKFESG